MGDYGYRVLQDGQPVASAYAPTDDAAKDLGVHYAWVYAQDGPVTLQRRTPRGHWRDFMSLDLPPHPSRCNERGEKV